MKHPFLFMAIATLLLLFSCNNYKSWLFSFTNREWTIMFYLFEVNNTESYVFRNKRVTPLLFFHGGRQLLEGRVWGN